MHAWKRFVSHSLTSMQLLLVAGAAMPATAAAQYFGQNKVQYRHFKYKVAKTDHFDIYYYPGDRRRWNRPAAWRSDGTPAYHASSITSSTGTSHSFSTPPHRHFSSRPRFPG